MPFLAGVKVQRAAVLFPTDSREKETRPPPFCLPPGLTPAGPARDTRGLLWPRAPRSPVGGSASPAPGLGPAALGEGSGSGG